MHLRRGGQSVAHLRRRRLRAAVAAVLMAGALVTATRLSSDPTELLCHLYTQEDPMWWMLACWRFPPSGSPNGS